jgi:hypothetical protein
MASLPQDVNDFLTALEGFNLRIEQDVPMAFQYLGYNPVPFLEAFWKKHGKEPALLSDLKNLLILFLLRGPNIDKMTKKMSEAGRNMVTALQNKYQIRKNAADTNPNEVTLPRLAAAFPVLVFVLQCRLHAGGLTRDPVGAGYNGPLPDVLRYPGAAWMAYHCGFWNAYDTWCLAFDKLIRKQAEDDTQRLAKIERFNTLQQLVPTSQTMQKLLLDATKDDKNHHQAVKNMVWGPRARERKDLD